MNEYQATPIERVSDVRAEASTTILGHFAGLQRIVELADRVVAEDLAGAAEPVVVIEEPQQPGVDAGC